jgi:hypothetical protein
MRKRKLSALWRLFYDTLLLKSNFSAGIDGFNGNITIFPGANKKRSDPGLVARAQACLSMHLHARLTFLQKQQNFIWSVAKFP